MSLSLKEKIDDFGFLALLVFFLVGAPIYVFKKHILGEQSAVLLGFSSFSGISGFIMLLLATYIVLTNIYLTFIRPRAYEKQHGSMEDYRNISPVPLVGSFLLWWSMVLLPSNYLIGVFCLMLFVLDTSGAPWAVVHLFREIILKK